jgi:signal peptidase I
VSSAEIGGRDESAPRRRIAPIVLALFFPGVGYFALGRWSTGFAFSLLLSALGYVSFIGAASGNMTLVVIGLALALVALLASVVHVAFAVGNSGRTPRTLHVVLAALVLLGIGDIEGALYRKTFAEAFKIPSGSMIPTLQIGDHIFADKRAPKPQRGDIIVFDYMQDPTKQFIKRCIAIGGDTVEMRDNVPVINGVPLVDRPVPGPCTYDDYDEAQDKWEPRDCIAFDETLDGRTFRVLHNADGAAFPRANTPPTSVPRGGCFAVGDNRDNSYDSRMIGPVPAQNIVGIARLIFWSRGSGRIGPVR